MKKAAATRLNILQKAFELIYARGYQATSIDEIIATTQVTKGAFFYHFKNKDEMGIAIIEEILKPTLNNSFISPLERDENPIPAIYNLMRHLLTRDKFLKPEYGCPAANFTHEMTPWNTSFSLVLNELTEQWMQVMTRALERGKKLGFISKDVNSKQVTLFVVSGYWGIRNLGKLGNKSYYISYLKELKNYLNTLQKI
ncbi:TetR/AcrR family transcriptional regulator [Niabella sp. 22666]|uniref:TetR/AcrR family transcriptional regulator n=1 Tax=Niabella sp. 22666 TaxID=3453954 RepID=UPI003F876721